MLSASTTTPTISRQHFLVVLLQPFYGWSSVLAILRPVHGGAPYWPMQHALYVYIESVVLLHLWRCSRLS
jgi:hypothetical protein